MSHRTPGRTSKRKPSKAAKSRSAACVLLAWCFVLIYGCSALLASIESVAYLLAGPFFFRAWCFVVTCFLLGLGILVPRRQWCRPFKTRCRQHQRRSNGVMNAECVVLGLYFALCTKATICIEHTYINTYTHIHTYIHYIHYMHGATTQTRQVVVPTYL